MLTSPGGEFLTVRARPSWDLWGKSHSKPFLLRLLGCPLSVVTTAVCPIGFGLERTT